MNKTQRFNDWLAKKITDGVATMWAAYLFALLALISLPAAIKTHDVVTIVAWIAQTFLQLVLLSIIMVGQNINSRGVEKKINETHAASLGEFELAKEARETANKELAELKEIARSIHRVIKDVESK
jgi:plasmid replication initiation protein